MAFGERAEEQIRLILDTQRFQLGDEKSGSHAELLFRKLPGGLLQAPTKCPFLLLAKLSPPSSGGLEKIARGFAQKIVLLGKGSARVLYLFG